MTMNPRPRTHPRTGRPIVPVGFRKDGRAIWPIMGASPDDGNQGAQGSQGAQGQQGSQDGNQGQQGDQGAQGQQGSQGQQQPAPTKLEPNNPDYFPANTPVAEMTVQQQAAYWKYNAKRHETRSAEWFQKVGGGNQSADQVAAALEAQRQASLTDQQKAVEDAEKRGREAATSAMAESLATVAFDTAMAHVPAEERKELLAMVNRTSVIREDGTIDTDKVSAIVQMIAPANGTPGRQSPDYGGGPRGTGSSKSGVGAGSSRYREQQEARTTKKTTATS